MYAIWLTFSKTDSEYLKNIINTLSKKYEAPRFEPHITVYGLVDLEINFIEKIVKNIIQNSNSFLIEKSQILQSKELWKTVYIELKVNNQIEIIYNNLKKHFEKIAKYQLNPHISLIYKILPKEEKLKIINGLNIKNNFMVKDLVVQEFFPDVEKWKIVRKINLI